MLKQGLYEQVVNTEIKDELRQLPEDSKHIEKIDAAESSSVLTQYLSEVVHKGLDRIAGDDISAQLNLVNKIVDLISQETAQDDLRDFTAVSYTHLDVYKRQFIHSCPMMPRALSKFESRSS